MESVLDSHFRTMDKLDDEAFIKKVKADRVNAPAEEAPRMCLIIDD